MQNIVGQDQVVTMHFTLMNADGDELDTSRGSQPMVYLHGHDNIVPGLEKALEGAVVGSKHKIVVEPSEGYGERDPEATQVVPRENFPADLSLEPGMQFATETPDGYKLALWIVEAGDDEVTITFQHPLVGAELHYDVEIVSIREATAHEVSRGGLGCSCC